VYIPGGCGHGFFSYEEDSIIVYAQEGTYDPPTEMNVNFADEVLKIQWPTPIEGSYIVSEKDLNAPSFAEALRIFNEKNQKI